MFPSPKNIYSLLFKFKGNNLKVYKRNYNETWMKYSHWDLKKIRGAYLRLSFILNQTHITLTDSDLMVFRYLQLFLFVWIGSLNEIII